MADNSLRLQKYLADCGVASRRKSEELIEQGIKPNTIRLSIGIENVDDLIEALDDAFKAVK